MTYKNIGIIGTENLGLEFALLLNNDKYKNHIFEIDEEKSNLLKHKIFKTQDYNLQKLLLSNENLNTENDLDTIVEKCETIFFFTETDTEENKVFLFNFIRLISHQEIIRHLKIVFCNKLSTSEIEKIENLCENKGITISYCFFDVEKKELESFKKLKRVLFGTSDLSIDNDIIDIIRNFTNNNIDISVISNRGYSIFHTFLDSYQTIENLTLNMYGDILINLGLYTDIGVVINYLQKSKNYKYNLGNTVEDNIESIDKLYKNVNPDFELGQNIMNMSDNHLDNLKKLYQKQNPNKENPFTINFNLNQKESDYLNKTKLCLKLLDSGYKLNIICEIGKADKLLFLSEKYENKVKFFKPSTNPEGFVINID